MKKPTFYFINFKGEKTRARSSDHPYKYALVKKVDDEEYVYCCSTTKDGCEKRLRQQLNWTPNMDISLYRIVELFTDTET